eukprot:155073-Rhodomonas_salina.2
MRVAVWCSLVSKGKQRLDRSSASIGPRDVTYLQLGCLSTSQGWCASRMRRIGTGCDGLSRAYVSVYLANTAYQRRI